MFKHRKIVREISTFDKCPLCGSKKKTKLAPSYSNRYSEDISRDLKIPEKYLLNLLSNVRCKNCDLTYKANWFNKNYLTKIFNKLIPIHPKGWDIKSNKFSKVFFLKCVDRFIKIIDHNSEKFKKSKRELYSIVASIVAKNKKEESFIQLYIQKIRINDFDFIKKNKILISNLINYPKPFSRYSGYKSENFYNHIEKKVGYIKNYIETGCPLWGMLELAKDKKCNVSFIKSDHCYFWGKNCKKKWSKLRK